MIRDVYSGSRIPDQDFFIPYLGSQIQGSKKHRIQDPDPQHWEEHKCVK